MRLVFVQFSLCPAFSQMITSHTPWLSSNIYMYVLIMILNKLPNSFFFFSSFLSFLLSFFLFFFFFYFFFLLYYYSWVSFHHILPFAMNVVESNFSVHFRFVCSCLLGLCIKSLIIFSCHSFLVCFFLNKKVYGEHVPHYAVASYYSFTFVPHALQS